MKENLAKEIGILLDNYGIDSFYACTIFAVLISISYRKQIREWDEQPGWQKLLIVSTLAAAIIFGFISLLRLLNIIDF